MRSILPLLIMASAFAQDAATEEQADKDRLVMATIEKLKNFDYAIASPKVKDAVGRFLNANRGSKPYFDFLERFHVAEEGPKLLEFGISKVGTAEAGTAFKTLVNMGQVEAIKSAILAAAPDKFGLLLDTLAVSQSREAAAVILQVAQDPKASADQKSIAVRSLGKSRNGELVLLEAVQKNRLPAEGKLAASQVLNASADTAIQKAGSELLPMAQSADNKPLPPIAELLARKGDVANGHAVYARICIACHKAGEEGIDFGPALSEIGTKLPKEAIYTAILDPNAAISFGFEGFEVKTTKGDSYIGMIASETDDELALKVPGGVIVKTPKADVASKTKLPISLMTPGLARAVTEQEFVDLVEYLSSLKKK